jgi:hypothetical protein
MSDFGQQDLAGSRFEEVHLERATFHDVHLNDADFDDVDLTGARFRWVLFKDVVMRGTGFVNVRIEGEIEGLTVNGVDVAPLVQAELERREPDLAKMRPSDPAGFRDAWATLERRWAGTVERARALPAAALHESVDGEWSFVETLRHLAFATESWLHRAILGDPSPWHPLSLPWDQMPDTEGVPRRPGGPAVARRGARAPARPAGGRPALPGHARRGDSRLRHRPGRGAGLATGAQLPGA